MQIINSPNISKSEIFLFSNGIETAVGWNWVVIQCIITLIFCLTLVFSKCIFYLSACFLNAIVLSVQVIKITCTLIHLSLSVFIPSLLIKSTFYRFMMYFKSVMETSGMRQSEELHAVSSFITWYKSSTILTFVHDICFCQILIESSLGIPVLFLCMSHGEVSKILLNAK